MHSKISNTVVHLSIYNIFVSGILYCVFLYAHISRLTVMDNYVTKLGRLIMTSLAHCEVTIKLYHAKGGINRSQTPGACFVHQGVWDKMVSWLSYLFNMGLPIPGKDGLYAETGPWLQTFSQSWITNKNTCGLSAAWLWFLWNGAGCFQLGLLHWTYHMIDIFFFYEGIWSGHFASTLLRLSLHSMVNCDDDTPVTVFQNERSQNLAATQMLL